MIGRTLSHYRVTERLGAGGMGEVYRAHDEKLDRDVALKVLPEGSLADEKARSRFHKEAHALSRLSHPHVATLLDFDTEKGTDFLVLELVTGPSLEERLRDGPLAEKDVRRLGAQLARGLQAAHERGIVHRDLKPSNLALTPDGLLKILDFGLARLLEPKPGGAAADTATETGAGAIVGSPPYMAPEQLLGKPPDPRTDLYAAGAVLYEMATGRRPFGARSGVALTDAILHEPPPPPRSVAPDVSPALESLILKALDKDPELRYQTAKDLLVDLERLERGANDSTGPRSAALDTWRSGRLRWIAAAIVALTALAVAAWLEWPPPAPRVTNVRAVTRGLDVALVPGAGLATHATDGVRLYYLAMKPGDQAALFQVPVTGGDAVEIPLPFRHRGRIYGYLRQETALLTGGSDSVGESTQGWPLWIVPVPAGAPRRLGHVQAIHAAASPDGRELALVQPGRILLTRLDGSVIRELGPLPSQPQGITWHPDGTRLRYDALGEQGDWRIWEIQSSGGPPRPLWPGRRGHWTADGRLFLFDRSRESESRSDLFVVPEARFPWRSSAEPVRLTHGPLSFTGVGSSPDGTQLFAWGVDRRGELLRYDESRRRFEEYLGGASAQYVDPSPDGAWLAWVSYPDGTLWKGRVDGSDRFRLIAPGWQVHLPRWSPDGQSLVFAGRRTDQAVLDILRIPSDGGEPEVLVRNRTEVNLWDSCWLPDGQTILYSYENREQLGIFRLDLRTREVSLFPGSERLQYPKCSSRGDVLATEKPLEGEGEPAWVFFADQGAWEPLGEFTLGYENWSRDGQSVTGLIGTTIVRWSRETGRVQPVVDVGHIARVSWPTYPWMGLAPDGSPLVVRDRSTADLYALDWEAP